MEKGSRREQWVFPIVSSSPPFINSAQLLGITPNYYPRENHCWFARAVRKRLYEYTLCIHIFLIDLQDRAYVDSWTNAFPSSNH